MKKINKKKIITLIPARMGSSRFPGKPLKTINGKSMIQTVYENASKSKITDHTFVATCDKIIFDHILKIGGHAIMTSKKHQRASDRCAEALIKLEKKLKKRFDIVVMIQGDEPLIKTSMLNKAIKPLLINDSINVVNLAGYIKNNKELIDRNCIKIVIDKFNNAIYFSREPIPSKSKFKNKINYLKQVCVIPFRRDFLLMYNKLKETKLEKIESIDMLRLLENGYNVHIVPTNYYSHAVDTPSDISIIQKYLNDLN